MIELVSASKYFNDKAILKNLSFKLGKSELVGIVGPVSYTHLTLPTTPYV